jgi:calcineurin-like phosphoesterase family protein
MNKVYLIADLHLGHKKVIEFESAARPFKTIEEHDNCLIERWNSVVDKRDTVWVLGDLLFGRDSFEKLKQLKGVKKLILGNHDVYPTELYLEHFSKIQSSVKLDKCLLTHIPIHPTQFRPGIEYNIHGHMHSRVLKDPRYFCVSAEQVNLTPVPFHQLVNFLHSTA